MIDHNEYKARQKELIDLFIEWNEHDEYHHDENCDFENGHKKFDDIKFAHALDELMLEVIGKPEDTACVLNDELGYHAKSCQDECFPRIDRNALRQSLRSIVKGSAKDD